MYNGVFRVCVKKGSWVCVCVCVCVCEQEEERGGLRPFPCHTHNNKWFEKRLASTHITKHSHART